MLICFLIRQLIKTAGTIMTRKLWKEDSGSKSRRRLERHTNVIWRRICHPLRCNKLDVARCALTQIAKRESLVKWRKKSFQWSSGLIFARFFYYYTDKILIFLTYNEMNLVFLPTACFPVGCHLGPPHVWESLMGTVQPSQQWVLATVCRWQAQVKGE